MMTRRQSIRSLFLGSSLFPALLSELLAKDAANPLAPKAPHFPGKAKRVIFIYLSGGMSHLGSFDPKAKAAPDDEKGRKFLPAQWASKPRGQSGIEVTDLFPHIAERVNDLCIIR